MKQIYRIEDMDAPAANERYILLDGVDNNDLMIICYDGEDFMKEAENAVMHHKGRAGLAMLTSVTDATDWDYWGQVYIRTTIFGKHGSYADYDYDGAQIHRCGKGVIGNCAEAVPRSEVECHLKNARELAEKELKENWADPEECTVKVWAQEIEY